MVATDAPGSGEGPAGREAVSRRIAAAVAALDTGRGAVLEIAGEPGMGKTSLLGLVVELAERRGARLARATALRGAAPSRQLFRDAWADLPARLLDRLTEADDETVFREVRTSLADWAAGGGVVVLDDVHLADEASLRLLARLVRTPVSAPLVLAVGHCSRRTGSVLLEALDDGARTGTTVRVELLPLAAETASVLLDSWYGAEERDPAFLAQLHDASGGNPRHLRILMAAGWRPELWPDSPGPDTGALLREAAAMAAELDALDPGQQTVVTAAAVLGGPFRSEDAAEISGIGLAATLEALTGLVRADVVRHVAPGALFAFRHPLLGHVAHERAPLPALLAGHQRALDLLTARGASAGDLARHAEHLIGANTAAAVPLLARGAAAILSDAPMTAARWLRLALQTPVGERPSTEARP